MEQKSHATRNKTRTEKRAERDCQIKKLYSQGMTYIEIAKELKINKDTVCSCLKVDKKVRDEKAKKYIVKGLSRAEICKLLDISESTYYRIYRTVKKDEKNKNGSCS